MLNKQLQAQIEQEAISLTSDRSGDDFHSGYNQGIEKGYMACAEKYASLWQQADEENKRLNKVLSSSIETSEKAIEKLGEAEQRAERYEKALKLIEQMSDPGDYWKAIIDMKAIATKALTPKTGSDEK